MTTHIRRWLIDRLTQKRVRHGIPLSMFIGTTPLHTKDLWPKLEAALDLIVRHSPGWLRRMQRMNNTIHVRRIPGNRARLEQNRVTILDPYLLANFPPAQVAASIVLKAHTRSCVTRNSSTTRLRPLGKSEYAAIPSCGWGRRWQRLAWKAARRLSIVQPARSR